MLYNNFMKANILLKYENKWVALNRNRSKVLYAAATIDQLNKVLTKIKEKDVILHYVMPFNGNISPLNSHDG